MTAAANPVVSERAEDALVIRAMARGDEHAIGRILAAHMSEVYGLLRLVMPTAEQAESALCETFAVAARRAGDPLSREDPARWLTGLALEQIVSRTTNRGPVRLEERRRRAAAPASTATATADEDQREPAPLLPEVLAGMTDRSLNVLIRRIDLPARRALVLGMVCRLDDGEIAALLGHTGEEVATLRAHGIRQLREMLEEHARREEELRQRIATVPYHLRPFEEGGGGKGAIDTEVRGTQVFMRRRENVLALLGKAIKRFVKRLFEGEEELSDDEVGGGGRIEAPGHTPTLKPFQKPKNTRGIRDYRQPDLTPGVATYKRPEDTPTTRRLSNRSRPLPVGAAWSSMMRPRGRL